MSNTLLFIFTLPQFHGLRTTSELPKKKKTCLSIRFCGVISIWFFSLLCYCSLVHSALQMMNWEQQLLMTTSSLFPASATLRLLSGPLICAILEVCELIGSDAFVYMLWIVVLLLLMKHFPVWSLMGHNWIFQL